MGNVTITVAGDERLQRTASVALPDWVLAKIGTGAPVTFSDDDQLGRELLRRWRAALVPAASGQEYWGIMGALAWIATRDMELARRAAIFDCACIGRPKVQPVLSRSGVLRLGRQARTRGDGQRRHELACLAHELFANGHCDCAPRPAEWSDCRCLDRALDQLRSEIERHALRGYASDGEATRRELTGADLIGLQRTASGLPWLAVANGIRRAEFDVQAVQQLFSARKQRGRPAGNGIDDSAALAEMVRLLKSGEASTPTRAARLASGLAAGSTYGTSTVDRLRTKYRKGVEK